MMNNLRPASFWVDKMCLVSNSGCHPNHPDGQCEVCKHRAALGLPQDPDGTLRRQQSDIERLVDQRDKALDRIRQFRAGTAADKTAPVEDQTKAAQCLAIGRDVCITGGEQPVWGKVVGFATLDDGSPQIEVADLSSEPPVDTTKKTLAVLLQAFDAYDDAMLVAGDNSGEAAFRLLEAADEARQFLYGTSPKEAAR